MLTTSQQHALDTSRHLSVTANAGSGKTMVLVERYINILTSGKAQVNEVVAITYTVKAASELKKKISESVAKKIAEAPTGESKIKLEEIRDQLSTAVVETIHSFYSRILREYPVEAGVDAAFAVLEGIDQSAMLETAVKETFQSILKEPTTSSERQQLFDLLRVLGKSKVVSIVEVLANKRERAGLWFTSNGLYTRSDDEIIELWQTHLTEFIRAELDDALLQDIEDIINVAGKGASSIVSSWESFRSASSWNDQLTRFYSLMAAMLTTEGKLRKKIFSAREETVKDQAARLQSKYKALQPFILFISEGNDSVHRTLLAQSRVLLHLYRQIIELYEEKKMEGAYLDFEDLQLRTNNLLRNDSVREKLARRFKYIMVDEYQDTNDLQYEILLSLVGDLQKASGSEKRGNLFIVGDPKQSIFGFRDADVTVFNRTKKDVGQKSGAEGNVILNDSFRPLRDIVAFVNLVFEPLMKADGNEFEVAYEPLIRGRQNSASGRVELILREENDEVSEGEMLARRILQLHVQKYQIYGKDEKAADVKFGDFAVLVRSRAALPDIEEAFVRHNVPYLITGGLGYFQTQGIYDFYNYFCFLLNTDDDVALVGTLRSPLFNVSDAELFEIAYEHRAPNLWKQLELKRGIARKVPRLDRAMKILRNDLEVASRLSVAELIDRIVEQTSYAGFVAGSSRSEQIFANLEKLKRLARTYEEQGFITLYDFVGRLKRLIAEKDDEGQAAMDVLADAVKIMTIHSSKGLEFPVVIVPALEREFRFDSEPFLDRELGVGFKPYAEDSGEEIPIRSFVKRRERQKTVAEERRIFYVACTRARDMLILSGVKSNSPRSYMNWLLEGLGIKEEENRSQLKFNYATECLLADEEKFIRRKEEHDLLISIVRSQDLIDVALPAPDRKQSGTNDKLLIEPISTSRQGEIFSASKIRTYLECPAKYYLRYVAGLPAPVIRLPNDSIEEEGDVSIPADLRGRAFHYILQHIENLSPDIGSLTPELRKFILRDSLSILSEPSIELEKIAASVIKVVQSDFWAEVKKGTDAKTEFTIMTPLGDNFLTGTLDRVYRDSEGIWTVLDYKTDAGMPSVLEQKAQLYEPQVIFYALLVRKYFQTETVRCKLLFTSIETTPVQFTYTSHQLNIFEESLRETIARIQDRLFERPSLPCAVCPLAPEGCPTRFN